ncbi:Crp/Fnr family transcriptional regulator [Ramlibacter sp.]|uniref:Crp/Fnr family transcriptional regulator n=1 Tax=Ramlibacter sp. TaxID=1917967 RepID=UPI003D122A87
MSSSTALTLPPGANHLLSLLDAKTLAAIEPDLEPVALPLRRMLEREKRAVRHVWFPTEGVGSMLAASEGGEPSVEVGTVGREGMVGLSVFFGATHALGDTFMQVAGAGWRMPAESFVRAARAHPDLTRVLHRYAQALMVQMSQAVACNRKHSPVQRCARWLLMTRDRVSGDTFDLTQEFLGTMLGERRVTVSRSESALRERGIIRYTRGSVTVLDRDRLEEAACPCYGVIRRAYETLLKG